MLGGAFVSLFFWRVADAGVAAVASMPGRNGTPAVPAHTSLWLERRAVTRTLGDAQDDAGAWRHAACALVLHEDGAGFRGGLLSARSHARSGTYVLESRRHDRRTAWISTWSITERACWNGSTTSQITTAPISTSPSSPPPNTCERAPIGHWPSTSKARDW